MNRSFFRIVWVLVAGSILSGCSTTVHVDRNNTSAPFDGSAANPFPTIQQGLDAAANRLGAAVEVQAGLYDERVRISRNNSLRGVGDVFIQGSGTQPTIVASGNTTISNIRILDGGVGIRFEWDGIASPDVETSFSVRRCEIRNAARGVEFTSPDTLAFGAGERVDLRLSIEGAWFRGLIGDAMNVSLRGPTTGSATLHLDVRDNIVERGFTALQLNADERRDSLGELPSAFIDGVISNNLFVLGGNGIQMDAQSRSAISPQIIGNTIARQANHGVSAEVDGGDFGSGGGVVGATLERNIIANNGGFGYQEFTDRTNAILRRNLFFANAFGHYADTNADDTVALLNEAAVNNLSDAVANRVADPAFVRGSAPILGSLVNTQPGPGDFFLGATSPAINAGDLSAVDAGLADRTTRTDFAPDAGVVDVGFHFTPP